MSTKFGGSTLPFHSNYLENKTCKDILNVNM